MSRASYLPIMLVVWGSALGLACPLVSAQVPEPSLADSTFPQLLQPVKLVPLTSRIIGPEVVRRQGVRVDFELVKTLDPERGNQIVFNLFPDTTFTGRVESKTFPFNLVVFSDAFSLGGSIPEIPGSSFQLLYLQGVLAADIRVPGRGEYQIRPTALGAYEVWKIDNSRFPSCAAGRPDQVIPLPADKAQGQSTSSLVDDGSIIDVMIAYTSNARLAVGGEINVALESAIAFIHANDALANSAINTKLNLVYLGEILYSESGVASTDLNRLTMIGDGFLDDVHTIRNAVGADIVSLFVASLDACGTSWLMSDVSPDFKTSAFNVCAISCAAVNLTYAHEIGHNLGCQHNREDAGGVQGAFPYSFGYQEPSGSFHTVMASPNGSPGIMRYSNPLAQVRGVPTGIPEGQANSADNAKTINNTAFTVANFRQAGCCEPELEFDCNSNFIEDADDISLGNSFDCNNNNIPDECEDDCNGNGIADSCDITDSISLDCNSNSIPDECEEPCNANDNPDECPEDCNGNGIADACDLAGSSLDCNANNVPDECEDDCNGNGIPDPCDIADGISSDCNANSISDECEVDCNSNGIPDECDIADGTSPDCNSNTVLDECEVDCDGNGIPDSCEIADGTGSDCNSNTILDVCEVLQLSSSFTIATDELSPIGLGFPVSHTFTRSPQAKGNVTLRFAAKADVGSIFQLLDVYLNDVFLEHIYRFTGEFCPNTPAEDQLEVTMADFNTLVNGGDVVIRIETFDGIAYDACNGTSWVSVSLNYQAAPFPVSDANDNGVPDVCDLARGDSNIDGIVNVVDLVNMLGEWGVCPGCHEDTNSDGLVNVIDLLILLSNWG